MRYRIFSQCLEALHQNDFEAIEKYLGQLDLRPSEPQALALATEIRSRISRKNSRVPDPSRIARDARTVADNALVAPEGIRESKFLLSRADAREPLPGVSLITGCMNREANLLKVIESWLQTAVDEIVLVDWSSRSEVWPLLAHISDPRLIVVRIDGEKQWVAAHAFNVGMRFACREVVFKVDCDIELSRDFVELNMPERGQFSRGFWKTGMEHGGAGQRFIHGTCGVYKQDLREVNYYDERMLTYGWADSDLYLRLGHDLGLAGKQLDPRSLRHLDQEEEHRISNQAVPRNQFLGQFQPTEFEAAKNKYYSFIAGNWAKNLPAQDYEISRVERRFYRGARVTTPLAREADIQHLAETLAARQLAYWTMPSLPGSGDIEAIGIEFSQLLRDAHSLDDSQKLVDSINDGTNILFLRSDFGPCCTALHKTLAILNEHYPSLASYTVIADKVSAQADGAVMPGKQKLLFASRELIETLAVRARAQELKTVASLADVLTSTERRAAYLSISVQSLADEAIAKATQFAQRLTGTFQASDSPVTGACLITSLYDEHNLLRLIEYLACVAENLKTFERIAICYEASSGLTSAVIQQMLEQLEIPVGRLLLVPYRRRPTFQDLFLLSEMFPPGTIVTVANADIAFDGSLAKIRKADLSRDIAVLSRHDVSADGHRAQLIRLGNGAPNTFSADAWIFCTPVEVDFHLDYPIGSFHCDSFINHQISKSARYGAMNPCLDIKAFHLHDDRFNSSGEKQKRDAETIKATLERERHRNGGADPIKGVAWSTVASATIVPHALRTPQWKPKALIVNLAACSEVTFGHFLVLHLLSSAIRGQTDVATVIRLSRRHLDGPLPLLPLPLLIARYQKHFSENFSLEVDDTDFDASSLCALGAVCRTLSFADAAARIADGSVDRFNESAFEFIAWPAGSGARLLRCEVAGDLSNEEATSLSHAVPAKAQGLFASLVAFFNALPDYSAEKNMLAPFIAPQVRPVAGASVDRSGLRNRPAVSFVTSLLKGGEFLRGYLENVFLAAKEAEGEVIIVDANAGDEDYAIVKDFLRENPAYLQYLDYVRLDEDPGLYECWRIGIERARAELITNANIDDRRAPDHTKRLVQLLNAHPEYAAACGSISCVSSLGASSWFTLCENQLWFYGEGIGEIRLEDLYRVDQTGRVRSRDVLHCMPVWRKSLHGEFGYFDEAAYGSGADWAFWLLCAKNGKRFAFDEGAFGRYFLNPDSYNRRNDPQGMKSRRIVKDFLGIEQGSFQKQ